MSMQQQYFAIDPSVKPHADSLSQPPSYGTNSNRLIVEETEEQKLLEMFRNQVETERRAIQEKYTKRRESENKKFMERMAVLNQQETKEIHEMNTSFVLLLNEGPALLHMKKTMNAVVHSKNWMQRWIGL